MRPRSTIAPLAVAHAFAVIPALAQPNLPPPPPPPIGEGEDLLPPAASAQPSRTLPTAPPAAAAVPSSQSGTSSTPARRTPPSASGSASPSPPPFRGAPRHHRLEVSVYEFRRRRPIALTIAPLPLALGRLSVGGEVLVMPHHSLVASPNVLLAQIDRGGRDSFASEGFGFASSASGSVGGEVGYHYWWHAHESLRGPFFGPSLLLGETTHSSIDPARAHGYWGFAWDVGGQEVFPGGFTLGAGAGVGFASLANATAFFPRILVQVGWSP